MAGYIVGVASLCVGHQDGCKWSQVLQGVKREKKKAMKTAKSVARATCNTN